MDTEVKKTFWSDAAKGGAIIGLAVLTLAFIQALFEMGTPNRLMTLAEFVIFVWLIYSITKKRGVKYGSAGFSYGQSMGFIIAMMLFVGIIVGFGNFLLMSVIKPEYFNDIFEKAIENVPLYDPDIPGMSEGIEMGRKMMTNPFFQILSGIFSRVVYGGVVGLVVSIFTKRKPDIFADTENTAAAGNE